MARITIKSDCYGNVIVKGNTEIDSPFYAFALEKVLAGKFIEISWEPITNTRNRSMEQEVQ